VSDDARAALPERLRRLSADENRIALPVGPALEAVEFFERHADDWRPAYVEPFAASPDGELFEQMPWIVATWGTHDPPIPGRRIPDSPPEAYAFVRARSGSGCAGDRGPSRPLAPPGRGCPRAPAGRETLSGTVRGVPLGGPRLFGRLPDGCVEGSGFRRFARVPRRRRSTRSPR
jgi:hypothetical protein